MNSLASRKKLLIAESELNRAQLVVELAALTADVHTLAHRAKSFGTIASSAIVLVAGLAAFRQKKSADAGKKPSWLETMLKGAGLVASVWQTFRPQSRDSKEK